MTDLPLSDQDVIQIQSHGLTLDQVREQLRLFARPPRFLNLVRPAIVADGIKLISPADREDYVNRQAEAARRGRFTKFVPASGVATRMFEILCHYFHHVQPDLKAGLEAGLAQDDPRARTFQVFFDRLSRFAFSKDLKARLAAQGHDLQDLLAARGYREILACVLTEAGLGYQDLPKALIKFHAYGTDSRTALEEHLVEAAAYVRDQEGKCRLHFTILPRHRQAFQDLLAHTQPMLEELYGCRFLIDFSYQHPGTDTLAADADNRPFRDRQGQLVFRPGGHGSLLENLNELQGDLVYIKNIDNVVPDRLQEPTIRWKKILGGILVSLQDQIHRHLRTLEQGSGQGRHLEAALTFAREQLGLSLPPQILQWPEDLARDFLARTLNRPLRVCGVVANQGEPGGAPFWVQEPDGSLSLQLVEQAQVDLSDPEQQAIWDAATHFNPVDLVCALRDDQGVPFDLREYVDHEAVFISRKSLEGRQLKALELPGLWNGAMARWLTVFVEVPLTTFNPVKTVFDLLRPEHQPDNNL
ncbi:MAG: DUF4301 family protein [Thermodesulfobacteriota bacterium]